MTHGHQPKGGTPSKPPSGGSAVGCQSKIGPDEMVMMLCEMAQSNGYGIQGIEMVGLNVSTLGCLPRHSYKIP